MSEEHQMSVRLTLSALRSFENDLSAGTETWLMYYVYIVRCKDDSLYTGFTSNLEKRIIEHNTSKLGAKSIKGKLPATLVYKEILPSLSEALKREREIKGWRKSKKEKLISLASLS